MFPALTLCKSINGLDNLYTLEVEGSDTLYVTFTGQGKAQCAAQTTRVIALTGASRAILIGSAGALRSGIYDQPLWLIDQVYEWDFKPSIGGIEGDSPRFSYPASLVREVEQSLLDNNARISIGTIVSGDCDVWKNQDREILAEKYQAELVAWESAGFIRALAVSGISGVEMRIPTDFSEVRNHKDFKVLLQKRFKEIAPLIHSLFKVTAK
ncbi:MAG: hypothetical protein OCD01_11675 [Fibrobacterales bacterium]